MILRFTAQDTEPQIAEVTFQGHGDTLEAGSLEKLISAAPITQCWLKQRRGARPNITIHLLMQQVLTVSPRIYYPKDGLIAYGHLHPLKKERNEVTEEHTQFVRGL